MHLVRVLVYPDYREANPYQSLLYRGLDPRFDVQFMPWRTALEAQSGRAHPAPIFHLHWEDAVYRMEPDQGAARRVAQEFVGAVEAHKERGGPVFWTIHNEQPHDHRYLEVHEAVGEALAALADMVVVHHPAAMRFVQGRWKVAAERIAIVPHGNYLDVYTPPGPGREARRREAGYANEDRVLLLFGRLDAYKGGAGLIRAFAQLAHPRLHLIIAGKQIASLDEALRELPEERRARVSVRDGFLRAAEIPALFDLADVVAAPYRAVLTSGTIMLAFSLGKPVLAPRLPGTMEWVRDAKNGLLYDQSSAGGLRPALERVMVLSEDELLRMGEAARESALGHDWAASRNLLNGLYAHAVLKARPPRLAGATDWYAPAGDPASETSRGNQGEP